MKFLVRLVLVLLLFVSVASLTPTRSIACCQIIVMEQADVEDEDEDEDEDEEGFNNNPWQIDERKLFAAKKFTLKNEFVLKVKQIDNICGLDKKQKLKLEIASKGAAEKALEQYVKDWKKYNRQFGGFEQVEDEDDEEEKKKKKRKKKRKEIVVKTVDEIDAQALQFLDQSVFTGVVNQGVDKKVKLWERTVKKVLTEEQQEKLDKYTKEMKLAKRNARADAFLTAMRIKLALADEQVGEFDKLVRPAFLKKDYNVNWNYDSMLTLYLGSKHDKKKMKELLSKEQQTLLEITTKNSEGYGHLFGDNDGIIVQAGEFNVMGGVLEGLFSFVEGFADALGRAFK